MNDEGDFFSSEDYLRLTRIYSVASDWNRIKSEIEWQWPEATNVLWIDRNNLSMTYTNGLNLIWSINPAELALEE